MITKVRKATGEAEFVELINAAEVVALAFAAVAEGKQTPQVMDLLMWICFELGRMPTDRELLDYLAKRGVKIAPIEGRIENFEN